MKTLISTIYLFTILLNTMAQTSIEGKVRDCSTFEPILFAGVGLYNNGVFIAGAETDLEGNFMLSQLQAGKYDIEVALLGYKKQRIEGIQCLAGQANRLEIKLMLEDDLLSTVNVITACFKLINIDSLSKYNTIITSDKIKNLPMKKIP